MQIRDLQFIYSKVKKHDFGTIENYYFVDKPDPLEFARVILSVSDTALEVDVPFLSCV